MQILEIWNNFFTKGLQIHSSFFNIFVSYILWILKKKSIFDTHLYKFDEILILINQTIPIWNIFFISNLRISSSFFTYFSDFYFFEFMNNKFCNFLIRAGPNPSNFGKMRWIC
jgi:hypothetical protein